MKFVVTKDRMEELTLDQAIALEALAGGEKIDLAPMRDLFAHFVVDEDGKRPAEAEAVRMVGRLRLNEVKEAAAAFVDAIRDGLLPPASDGS
jgi:hypothetical protein